MLADLLAKERVGGTIEVGFNDNDEVVVNLDQDRTGHLIFSPLQAMHLSNVLAQKALEVVERWRAKHPHADISTLAATKES